MIYTHPLLRFAQCQSAAKQGSVAGLCPECLSEQFASERPAQRSSEAKYINRDDAM